MAEENAQTEHRFDESGALITDQNYEGESRSFEELDQTERDAFVGSQKAEVAKLNDIITRKGNKVKTLNEALKDDGDDSDGKKEPDNKPDEPQNDGLQSLSQRQDRMELRQEGYPDDVIDHIMEMGGKSALDNPIVKQSADTLRKQHQDQQAADIGDGPQGQTRTKYSKEELKNMSVEEIEKVLPHAED